MTSLDLLPGIGAIALFLYDSDDESAKRRTRRRIANGDIPVIRTVTGRIESRISWIASRYAEPDPVPQQNGHEDVPEADRPICAEAGCSALAMARGRTGRPPKYCAGHRRG